MRVFLKLFGSISILLFATISGNCEDKLNFGPIPSWASDVEIPESEPEREKGSSGGIHYLLASNQTRFKDQTRHIYLRYAYKITERQGLETGGNIQISFRPETDHLTIHRVYLIRDGEKRELLGKLKFDVIQREKDIEKGILDGSLTAYSNVPRMRVGDVLEYSYSLTYKSILMENEFFTRGSFTYVSPGELLERVVIFPKALDVKIKQRNINLKPEIRETDSEKTYYWISENPEARASDSNEPNWYNRHGRIEISSVKSWKDVIEDSIPHYQRDDELPAEFIEEIKKIDREEFLETKKLARVLSLVQNEIRYVGIEIGRGAFIPRLPSTVIARGYGDCKDKSYLMVKALELLNIKAVPALANLDAGHGLIDRLPTPYAFDHVIVRAQIDDKIYWLDPTGTYQDDPDPLKSQSNYGYVLPIGKEFSSLEKISIEPSLYVHDQYREEIKLNYGRGIAGLTYNVRSTYRGSGSDDIRRSLARNGEKQVSENYLEYYRGNIEDLEVAKPLVIEFDPKLNITKVLEQYSVPQSKEFVAGLKKFVIRDSGVMGYLPEIIKQRNSPVALKYPYSRTHEITISNLDENTYKFVKPVSLETPFFKYNFSGGVEKDTMTFKWEYSSKRDHVKVEELAQYIDARKSIYDSYYWTYDLRSEKAEYLPETKSDELVEKTSSSLTTNDLPEILALLGMFFGIVVGLFGWRYGLKADEEYRQEGVFFPVSLTKFSILSFVTTGAYTIFWFHKFWRWQNFNSSSQVWAFVRAIFWPVTYWFALAVFNTRSENRFSPLVAIVLSLGCIGLFVWGGYEGYYEYAYGMKMYTGLISVVSIFVFTAAYIVLTLPLVKKVNEEATNQGKALDLNSKFNIYSYIGILFFPGLVYLLWVSS